MLSQYHPFFALIHLNMTAVTEPVLRQTEKLKTEKSVSCPAKPRRGENNENETNGRIHPAQTFPLL